MSLSEPRIVRIGETHYVWLCGFHRESYTECESFAEAVALKRRIRRDPAYAEQGIHGFEAGIA